MSDDGAWLSPKLRTQLRVIVAAINTGTADIHTAVRASINPPPSREEIDALLRILDMLGHQPGESAGLMMARMQDAFEAMTEDEADEPPSLSDDRY